MAREQDRRRAVEPAQRPAVSRRQALLLGAGTIAQAALSSLAKPALAGGRLLPLAPIATARDPFQLGVASGEPEADGFVLWTRLAPDPLSKDPEAPGGIAAGDLFLRCEIAEDPEMRRVVQSGTVVAEARFAHSVHLEVTGLKPGRPYWYRFMTDDAVSRVGRAMTAPAPGAALEQLRFGFVSCSNYEQGYFAAYRHLAAETPDLVLFLGDYIYETVGEKNAVVRTHSDGVPAATLAGYRNRYAQYRLDPDLQALHAAAPALMIWDDHEVQNDYAGQWSESFDDPVRFLLRRAAAYQAFYEHMPVRPSRSTPHGPAMRVYDRFRFGDLVSFSMLDGRQYRSREACYAPPHGGGQAVTAAQCPELLEASRTMLGAEQEAWLYDGLARSRARWNIIGQNVLMAPLHSAPDDGTEKQWTDAWDGYPACRQRLMDHIAASGVANPVVLSGDNHAFWANDLKRDFRDPSAPAIATEFVGTSVSSNGPPYDLFKQWLPYNPHVRFFDSRQRGYVSIELAPDLMTARFQAISDAADPNASLSTLRTFAVEAGRKGAMAA